MATGKSHVLTRCKNYNGHSHIEFMMEADDSRIGTDNWQVIEAGSFDCKAKRLTTDSGPIFQVFPDWSVRLVGRK